MSGASGVSPVWAEVVLVIHLLFVAFVVGGFGAIWVGAWRRWSWIRRRGFRLAHIAGVVFVALSSVLGMLCPLTVLEDHLRGNAREVPGFIARWIGRVLYYDFPEWVFTLTYVAFAGLVIATYFIVPPSRGG